MKAAIKTSKPLDKQPKIFEYAVGNIANRNTFRSDDYQKELFYTEEAYRSIFSYDESVLDHIKKNVNDQPSILGYKGEIGACELVISIKIDEGDTFSNIEQARASTIGLVTHLHATYGLAPNHISYEFGGNNGFHIKIPGSKFGSFKRSLNLRKYHKALCLKLTNGMKGIDPSIYEEAGLMRIKNTKHGQTSLYSIPLSHDQLVSLSSSEILEKAKRPNPGDIDLPAEALVINDNLALLYEDIIMSMDQNKGKETLEKDKEVFYSITHFEDIVRECMTLSSIVKKAEAGEEIEKDERIFLESFALTFGPDGRIRVHKLLANQPYYDADHTNAELLSLSDEIDEYNLCDLICEKSCNTMKIFNANTPLAIPSTSITDYCQASAIDIVIETFGNDLIFKSDQNCFYYYWNGVFSEINEHDLHSLLNTCLGFHFKPVTITDKKIIELKKRMTMCEHLSYTGELNPFPYLLNLKNGMYDIKTGEFLPHSPKYRSTVQLNIEYDPSAKCELYSEKLNEIFDGDADKIDYFLQWMLYCLLPTYQYQKFLILYGTGRNGKGVLTTVLTEMIGKNNCSHESLADISSNSNYSVINLKDKLVNFSSEMSTREAETDVIKRLTGGDPTSAREIYQSKVQFKNFARLIILTNSLPRVANLDKAFLGRMEIIEFTKSFVDNPDGELDIKLIKEISGIFNLFIEQRTKIFKEDGSIRLQMPESLKTATKKLSSNLHSVTEFIDEECEVIEHNLDQLDKATLFSALYAEYKEWALTSGYHQTGMKIFKEVIVANTGCLVQKLPYIKTRTGVAYKNQVWILGISLNRDISNDSISFDPNIRESIRNGQTHIEGFNESAYLADLDRRISSHNNLLDNSTVDDSSLDAPKDQGFLDDEFFQPLTFLPGKVG